MKYTPEPLPSPLPAAISFPEELTPHFLSLEDAEQEGWKGVSVNLDLTSPFQKQVACSIRQTLAGESPGSRPVRHAICWDRGSRTHCYLLRRADELVSIGD